MTFDHCVGKTVGEVQLNANARWWCLSA